MNWTDKKRKSHVRITDRIGNWQVIARDKLTRDGHPAISPEKKILATDTYIVNGKRNLYLVDPESENVWKIASFNNPSMFDRDVRCNPYLRWQQDGKC
ncbi:MAG: hypothetical protein ACTSVI_16560 [Promethearchaeota archaeon]